MKSRRLYSIFGINGLYVFQEVKSNSLFHFCLPSFLVAQHRIDSLKGQLQNATKIEERVDVLSNISEYYFASKVHLDSSFFYAETAFFLAKKENIEFEQARALFNLGLVRKELYDFDKAIDYFLQSRALSSKLNLTENLSVISSNIGNLYFEKEDYTNAIINYDKAIAFSKEVKDTVEMAIGYLNVGEAQYRLGKLEVAEKTLESSLDILEDLDLGHASGYLNYAHVLFELNKVERSKSEVAEALKIAEKEGDIKVVAESTQLLSDIYKSNKEFEKSLAYLNKTIVYKRSLETANERNEIEKLKLNFELNKKKGALNYLSQKSKYRRIIYALAAAGIILLILLILRQLKIIRMTEEIREAQRDLMFLGLKDRETKERGGNSGLETVHNHDKELLDDQ